MKAYFYVVRRQPDTESLERHNPAQFGQERGEPSARLGHLAQELDALFIVVGASHRGLFHHLTGASVSRRLLHGQPRPVLVVPAPGEC